MCDLEKNMLSSKGKTKFIAAVAAAIFRFKSYPTSDEYVHIGQQIITEYPFLKSSSGCGYVSIDTELAQWVYTCIYSSYYSNL